MTGKTEGMMQEIPTVDWFDLQSNREKFLQDLKFALSECGFLVLANAPGLDVMHRALDAPAPRGRSGRPITEDPPPWSSDEVGDGVDDHRIPGAP